MRAVLLLAPTIRQRTLQCYSVSAAFPWGTIPRVRASWSQTPDSFTSLKAQSEPVDDTLLVSLLAPRHDVPGTADPESVGSSSATLRRIAGRPNRRAWKRTAATMRPAPSHRVLTGSGAVDNRDSLQPPNAAILFESFHLFQR